MSCFHPLLGIPTGELTENGKKRYFIKSLKSTTNIDEIFKKRDDIILIPCGKCLGCRCDYSRNWADRMMLELEETKKAVFLTLTYNEEHVPRINDNITGEEILTLNKRDCQLFMKRLRKEFGNDKCRFFLSGEYGDKTDRPHYHCIIFGINRDDIGDCVDFGKNELGDNWYTSERLQKVWSVDKNPIGFVLVADVNWKTCAYVARYILKKLNGELLEDKYASSGRVNNFSLMSRKPGIGKRYLENHPEVLDLKKFNLSTPEGGLEIYLPKYYLRELIREPTEKFPNPLYDPDKYDKMCKDRKKFANNNMLIELSNTNLTLVDYLEKKEMKKYSDMQHKKRSKV